MAEKITSIKKETTKKATATRKRTTTKKAVTKQPELIEVVVTPEGKYIELKEFTEHAGLANYSHDTIVDIVNNTALDEGSMKVDKVSKEDYEINKMPTEKYFKKPEPTLLKGFRTKFGNYVLFTDVLAAASIFVPYNLDKILKMNREDFVSYVLSLPAIEEYKEDLTFDEYTESFTKMLLM